MSHNRTERSRSGRLPRFQMVIAALTVLLSGAACGYPPEPPVISGAPVERFAPPPENEKKLVALAGFENRSTYSADKLWETSAELLRTELLVTRYFRVVEWERMKELIDYDTLTTNSLFQVPGKAEEVRKILLCEYFLMGAITRFDVSQSGTMSALSKNKEFNTTIQVVLTLRDARTGEYLCAGKGEGQALQTFSGGLGGSQTGSWDPNSADKALDRAIASALSQLILNYTQKDRRL